MRIEPRFIARFRAKARRILRAPVGKVLRTRERLTAHKLTRELAVCAIFRNEAPFLNEWLAFHLTIGATHFYLYNNESTDHFGRVLHPWRNKGLVTLTDWPGSVQQIPAYSHCIQAARAACRWVAFIDVDEFLFSPDTIDIRPILREYGDLPGLVVWTAVFGSGGQVQRPNTSVSLTYRKRAPLAQQSTVKTIANPRLAYKAGIHEFKFWGADARDTARHRIADAAGPVVDRLRINHYWSRSLEDLKTKIARGDASTSASRSADWHYAFERTLNSEADETILPVARAVPETARALGIPCN